MITGSTQQHNFLGEEISMPEEWARTIYSCLDRGDYSQLDQDMIRVAQELQFTPNISGSFERWVFLNNIHLL